MLSFKTASTKLARVSTNMWFKYKKDLSKPTLKYLPFDQQIKARRVEKQALRHLKNNRYTEAIEQLHHHLADCPHHAYGHFLLGQVAEKSGLYPLAQSQYAQALNLHTLDVQWWYRYIRMLMY